MAPGSEDPGVVRQRGRGKLTCRERIDLLLDRWIVSRGRQRRRLRVLRRRRRDRRVHSGEPRRRSGNDRRAHEHRLRRRLHVAVADTRTERSARRACTSTDCRWSCASRRSGCSTARQAAAAWRRWCPSSSKATARGRAQESKRGDHGWSAAGVSGGGGSFLPGHLGSTEYAEQLATVPVVNVLLGSVVGIGAAKAVLGHFSVMVRDIASSSSPARRSCVTRWATTSPRRTSATGRSTAATARWTTSPRPRRRRSHGEAVPLVRAGRASTTLRRSHRRPTQRIGGARSCSRSSRASARRRSTFAGRSSSSSTRVRSSRSVRCGAPIRSPALPA